MKGAPTHRCGQPMELGAVNYRICFVCLGCSPKFPDRTKRPLHCPVDGELMKMHPWPSTDGYCSRCERWYKYRPWDERHMEAGMMPVFEEHSDDELLEWKEAVGKVHKPWGKGDGQKQD